MSDYILAKAVNCVSIKHTISIVFILLTGYLLTVMCLILTHYLIAKYVLAMIFSTGYKQYRKDSAVVYNGKVAASLVLSRFVPSCKKSIDKLNMYETLVKRLLYISYINVWLTCILYTLRFLHAVHELFLKYKRYSIGSVMNHRGLFVTPRFEFVVSSQFSKEINLILYAYLLIGSLISTYTLIRYVLM